MDLGKIADGADRFAVYITELTSVIGHADRAAPLRDYCTGLLAAEGRRSVEPMAAVTAPNRVSAQHQKLLHLRGSVVGPGGAGQGARTGDAGDRAARADQSVDSR